MSFPVLADAHAPQQWLVRCHGHWPPGVSWGDWLVGIGGAHQRPKLQDLVVWTREELDAGGLDTHFVVYITELGLITNC